MVRLSFLGAMNEVGSSGVLVETGKERIVLDYGTNIQDVPPTFPHAVKDKVDAVFLGHSHLDHSGGLPVITKSSHCPIYTMSVSKPLVQMLLNDSLKISRSESVPLPYNRADVDKTIRQFKAVEYRKPITVGSTSVVPYDAGHIPGSMMTLLHIGNRGKGHNKSRTLLYTSDFNTNDTRLIRGADTDLPEIDVLITESTYSGRDHKDREAEEKRLIKSINATLANDGTAIVSNFAISRTQEVMLILEDYGIDYPLYMDGMAKKATTVINSYTQSLLDPTSLDRALRKVQYLANQQQRKRILKNPCVILTTSGMLNGGPVVWYLKKLHKNPRNLLILTGFQVSGTPGHELLESGRFVHEGSDLKLNMKFERLDFSSHLGRKELFAFVEKINPKKIFCMHGDDTPKFAGELCDKGLDAVAPVESNRTFDL